jgi:arylsulfatase A-like enzyme
MADKKPNILIMFGDDIGWFNISAYNHGIMGYQTPNIDRIAKEGALFTDAYGQQSCTAGRAAFITGQSPYRTGLTKVGLPGSPLGLKKEDPTLAEFLKPHGYASGQFGKNHLGDLDEHLPTAHGFDEFFGNLYHLNAEEEPENPDYPANPQFKEKFGPRGVMHSWAQPDGTQKIEDTGPLTKKRMETIDEEVLGHAQRFIREKTADDQPWFCWFNTTRMHVNTHLKPESQGVTGKGIYADGMVEHDGHIGQMLGLLDELGVTDDTFIVYTTDNGAEVMSWPDGGTTIFHSEKNSSWEGGYRIPLVIRYPKAIEPGTISNGIVSLEDFVPTIMGAVGEPDLKEKLLEGYEVGGTTYKVHLDGHNFVPYLKGNDEDWPRREFFYFTDDGDLAALRFDDWKILFLEQRADGFDVWSEPFVPLRLPRIFNLRSDPLEKAIHESWGYQKWQFDHVFMMVPAQEVVAKFMSTFAEYPPRQKAASFSVEQGDAKLTEAASSGH